MKRLECSLTNEQAAYLAALIDGEGSIGFNKHKSKSSKRGYIYVARVSVSNTYFDVIKWAREITGFGSLHVVSRVSKGWKDTLILVWMAKQAQAVLKSILPYMIIKKKQAELVLQFIDRQYIAGLKLGLSDAEWAERVRLVEECSVLNKRGRLVSN